MYVMDYGAPVGYRLALKHPDRVSGLIVQNGNAYDEGIRDFWNPIRAYWTSGAKEDREALSVLVAPETTKFQYTDGVNDLSRISPITGFMIRLCSIGLATRISSSTCSTTTVPTCLFTRRSRPSSADRKPPTLVVWGKNDQIFPEEGAHPYLRDLPRQNSISSTRDILHSKTSWMRWRRSFEASLIARSRSETQLASGNYRNGCGEPHPAAAFDEPSVQMF